MRGATSLFSHGRRRQKYFNPRSSCEERRAYLSIGLSGLQTFQSTLLMRGATIGRHLSASSCWNFNPRSSCEERLAVQRVDAVLHISIHAPHARSDVEGPVPLVVLGISIHAPHARSDLTEDAIKTAYGFQSTLLMRGATRRRRTLTRSARNFNPRSSCEERPFSLPPFL